MANTFLCIGKEKRIFGIHIFVWFQQHFHVEIIVIGQNITIFVALPLLEEATTFLIMLPQISTQTSHVLKLIFQI